MSVLYLVTITSTKTLICLSPPKFYHISISISIYLIGAIFKGHKSRVNILHSFSIANYIDGATFMGLTVAEIKEIVPPIGLAKKVVHLLPKVCNIFLSPFALMFS